MVTELKNPLVLGVQAAPSRHPPPVFELMGQTGRNTGNLLFASAASAIAGTENRISPRQFQAEQAAGHDCIILSAANWLGPGADFGAVSEQLDAANVPIIVLGLGAQAGLDQQIPRLHPGTRRLISLLAERSPMISARGPFSADVLAHYGAQNVMVTGCPSLLKSKGVQPSFEGARGGGALRPEDVVVHSTRHHYNPAAPFHAWLYREALRGDYDLLLQSETADLFFTEGRKPQPHILEEAMTCLEGVYLAAPEVIATYLQAHGKCFFSVEDWMSYYRTKRFVIGTRIHGTIAAVLAGVPALLIAHDARTVELAETMGIPFVLKDQIDMTVPLDTERYYNIALDHDFTPSYQRYREGFRRYFEVTGLKSALPV